MAKRRRANHFRETVFRNGMTLVTERMPGFKGLSIGVWVKVGTRHERRREAGASHFLEHMLFKGTAQRTALEIAREVDRAGGEFNAFTAREYTCFHLLLLERDIALGIDILSDILLNSTFDSTELERERKVILQEIAMVEESPEELVHDVFFELVYGKHSLGRPILGTEHSIRRMRRSDLMRYFRRHYRPDQLIVSVAGDVTHETVKRKLKPLVRTHWPGRPNTPPRGPEPGSGRPPIREGRWWMVRATEQVHLVWGVEGTHYNARDKFPALLLNIHLGGGMSSSLFQEIREKNALAYTVYSSLSPFADSGVFSIYAATSMSQIPLCLKLIEDCVGSLRDRLLTEDELRMAKENLKGTILLSSDSVESRMSSIAKNQIFDRSYSSAEEICRMIDAVTAADLRRVARKFLRGGRRSVLFMGPRPSPSVRRKLRPTMLKR